MGGIIQYHFLALCSSLFAQPKVHSLPFPVLFGITGLVANSISQPPLQLISFRLSQGRLGGKLKGVRKGEARVFLSVSASSGLSYCST